MILLIVTDDEFVKIGGILLPGVFKSIEVKGNAIVEELEVEGKGKKPKQATGYEDHTVSIELILMDDLDEKSGATKEEKLIIIQNIFRKQGQKIPQVYDLVNSHTAQRGIGKVIFNSLSTKEINKKEEIDVSLNFLEYEAINVTAKAFKKSSSTDSSTNESSIDDKKSTSKVGEDYSNYLKNNRGIAPKIQNKEKESPTHIGDPIY